MMKIEDLKIIPGLFSFKVDTPNERSACRQRFIIWELGVPSPGNNEEIKVIGNTVM